MKRWMLPPLALGLLTFAQGCSIARALYIAVVHNSGAPPSAERARIADREAEMLRHLSDRRVVVLPLQIIGRPVRPDTDGARLLAERLRSVGFTRVSVTEESITLPFEPQPNELLTFWTRFKALAAAVAARPRTDADYVLLVDVFGRPDQGSVGAVHAVAVTANGEMAYRAMWNSHQKLYKEFTPRSIADAAAMVVADISRKRDTLPANTR